MKNNLVFGIIVGVVLSFGLDAIAENIITSNSVSYSNNKTAETTVNGALNELFSAVDINERLGSTDISSIGNGTITGAINTINTNVTNLTNKHTSDISNINTSLSGKAATSHTHDERYYTEAEVNNLLNAKQNSAWVKAGNITALKTAISLPSTWKECKVTDADGFSVIMINNDENRTGYIVNAIKVDASSILVSRATVKTTASTVYIHDRNQNGTWEQTLSQAYTVYYR